MGDRGEGVMRSRCAVEVDSEADFLSQQRREGERSRNEVRGRSENEVIGISIPSCVWPLEGWREMR